MSQALVLTLPGVIDDLVLGSLDFLNLLEVFLEVLITTDVVKLDGYRAITCSRVSSLGL